MKILYFLAHPEGIGGASHVMIKHASIMQRKGHDVLVVIQNDSLQGGHDSDYDIKCKEYGLKSKSSIYHIATCVEEIDIINCVKEYNSIDQIVKSFIPDIIHSLQINIAVEISSRNNRIPHVMSAYPVCKGMFNLEWYDVLPKYLLGDTLYCSKKWGLNGTTNTHFIRVPYQSNNYLRNHSNQTDKKQLEVLCIGVLATYKNQLEIIKFIGICKDRGIKVHLNVLGFDKTNYAELCKNYVLKNKLEDCVSFYGFSKVEQFYKNADLLIHASKVESFPGVLVEAMANKIPIMVSPVGGIPELLIDKENCIYINGFESKDIWNSFEVFCALRQNKTVDCIVKNARKTYNENHTFDIIGDELEKYYLEIINKEKQNEFYAKTLLEDIKHIINSFDLKYSSYTLEHIWFLWHIKKQLNLHNHKKVAIWGIGQLCDIAVEWTGILSLELKLFVDSFKGGTYLGYPVNEPNEAIFEFIDVVFVTVKNTNSCQEIGDYLSRIGFVRNINYFFIENNSCINLN